MKDQELRSHFRYIEKMSRDRNVKLEKLLQAQISTNVVLSLIYSGMGILLTPPYPKVSTKLDTPSGTKVSSKTQAPPMDVVSHGEALDQSDPEYLDHHTPRNPRDEGAKAYIPKAPRETPKPTHKPWKYDPETGCRISQNIEIDWLYCPYCCFRLPDGPLIKCPECGEMFVEEDKGE